MAVAALVKRNTDDPELPSYIAAAYTAMEPRWKFCRDVHEGTEALRRPENLDIYFPKGGVETDPERLARVYRAELFPMFQETVEGLVGLALRTDPKLGDDVPAAIKTLWPNIDGAGTAGPVFLNRVFEDALVKGHSGVLVDVPKVTSSKVLTIRQAKDIGLRPYAVHVKPEQIINWRTQIINGNVVLTLLVISEIADEPLGTYGTQEVTKYRVFIRDEATGLINYEVWTQGDQAKDPEFDSGGILTATTRIPFAVCYGGKRTAALQSLPPLLNLAYTNIAHVQVLSDHRTGLHATLNPILCTKDRTGGGVPVTTDPNRPAPPLAGVPGQSFDNPAVVGFTSSAPPLALGVNVGIDVGKDGDVWYAEPSGTGLSAADKELTNIETRGAAQGLSMLQRDNAQAQTAQAERLQRVEKNASLSTGVRSLKDMAETMLAFFALFLGETTGGTLVMDFKFEDKLLDAQKIQVYSTMVGAGQLTRKTLWKMIAGELPDDFDPVAEDDALSQAERITLTTMTNPDGSPKPTAKDDTGSGGGAPAGSGGGNQ